MNIQRISFGMANFTKDALDRVDKDRKKFYKNMPYPYRQYKDVLDEEYTKELQRIKDTFPESVIHRKKGILGIGKKLYVLENGTDVNGHKRRWDVETDPDEPLTISIIKTLKQAVSDTEQDQQIKDRETQKQNIYNTLTNSDENTN